MPQQWQWQLQSQSIPQTPFALPQAETEERDIIMLFSRAAEAAT